MTSLHPSATGLTIGTPDAAKPPPDQRERSLVPVEKEPVVEIQNATSKATVPHGGHGFNRKPLGVL